MKLMTNRIKDGGSRLDTLELIVKGLEVCTDPQKLDLKI